MQVYSAFFLAVTLAAAAFSFVIFSGSETIVAWRSSSITALCRRRKPDVKVWRHLSGLIRFMTSPLRAAC
jgi:hypothetical protein